MDSVNTMRNILLHEMETGIRSICKLLEKVEEEDWPYRPAPNMRSLKELAWHLIAIPEIDLAIMQETDQVRIQLLEKEYEQLEHANNMETRMWQGYHMYKTYITSLSDEAFLTKITKPFYLETSLTQARWLTETVTHIFHHRAQFFTYLKQIGRDVSMNDLYV